MNKERVLVVGETCMDTYIYGQVPRLCPEAPVPIFVQEKVVDAQGMAANVAANLRALGQWCDLETHPQVINKIRYVEASRNHLLLRLDADRKVQRFNRNNVSLAREYLAVVISDYDKGYLTKEDIQWLTEQNPVTFVDTKKPLGPWLEKALFIKINAREWAATPDQAWAKQCLWKKLIVTQGAEGCAYADKHYPAVKTEVMDIVGAGDTFLAAIAARYLVNQIRTGNGHIEECLGFANKCAAQVVSRRGTSVVEGMYA